MHAQVDGVLTEVKFKEGQIVKKGDVIAQIDPRPFAVQLHNAEGALARDQAQVTAAKADYNRQKNLHDQNLVAQNAVDAAAGTLGNYQGAVKIDQAAIESARLNLDYASVKAPLDGITGIRLVDAGNLVHATDTTGLVVITAIDPAAVIFTLPQDRLTDISKALARGSVEVDIYSRDGVDRARQGHARGARQPGQRVDRDDAAQGARGKPRPRAVAERVRQGARARRDEEGCDRRARGRGAARAERRVRLRRRRGFDREDDAGDDRADDRRDRGDQQGRRGR